MGGTLAVLGGGVIGLSVARRAARDAYGHLAETLVYALEEGPSQ